jgi:hypothetical protein
MTGTLSAGDLLLADDTRYDLFRFEAAAGERLAALMASPNFDAYLYLYDAQRQIVASDDDGGGGTDAYLEVEVPAGGTYYLMANAYDVEDVGGYRLQLWRRPAIAWDQAISVDIGERRLGTLDAEDPVLDDGAHFDLYAVELPAEALIRVDLSSMAFDAFLWVYDADHIEVIASDDANGRDASALLRVPSAGRYTVIASSFGAGETGPYELQIDTGLDTDVAVPVAVGDEVDGELTSADGLWVDGTRFDLYTLSGVGDEPLRVTLTSTAFDAYLHALGPGFSTLDEDDDSAGGSNARLTLPPSSDGIYLVVTTYSVGEQGAYALRIEPDEPAGQPLPWDQAQPVAVGVPLEGELSADDPRWEDGTYYDLFAFEGMRGEIVDVRLRSESFDAHLMVYGPDRSLEAVDDDSGDGTDAWVRLEIREDGRYTVMAHSYFEEEVGRYTLIVEAAR